MLYSVRSLAQINILSTQAASPDAFDYLPFHQSFYKARAYNFVVLAARTQYKRHIAREENRDSVR
jgi:hypothetical protein